ncbi:MAG: phage tail protein [Proteobacteria bacterium]|nr:phage tail protein [Pseudomonadota bacterium]
MAMTLLPTPPNTIRPETFAEEMDAFLGALPTFQAELNGLGSAFALSVSSVSTTSLTIGAGLKTLAVQTGRGFAPGMDVVCAWPGGPTNRMIGTVFSYDAETGNLVMDVYSAQGSGTYAAWSVIMNAAVDAAQFVTPTGTQTLSNKTLTSPVMTGNPTVPTAAPGTNTDQSASCAFVRAAISALVASSPAALDTLNELAAALGNDANFSATMTTALAAKAPLASPALTGAPTGPTAPVGADNTQLANTAFVQAAQVAGRLRVTATGAIAAGKAVAQNSDGTVSEVAYSLAAGTLGAEQTFSAVNPSPVQEVLAIPDTNKVVVLYGNGSAICGAIDTATSTVSWGSPVTGAWGSMVSAVYYPPDNLIAVVYSNTGTLSMQLISISGTALSVGTASTGGGVVSAGVRPYLVYNAHQAKLMVLYYNSGLYGRVVTVLSGVMTWATSYFVSGTNAYAHGACEVSGTPQILVAFNQSGANNAVVVTVNASTLSVGVGIGLSGFSGTVTITAPVPLSYAGAAGKYVLIVGTQYIVLTVSGTTVTPGVAGSVSSVLYDPTNARADYDWTNNKLIIHGFDTVSNKYAIALPATLSGNSLSFETPTVMNASMSATCALAFSAYTGKFLMAFEDLGDNNYGHSRVWDAGDSVTTAGNWVGIAEAAIAAGAQGYITIRGGINKAVSGLTPGYLYYLDDTGTLQQSGSRLVGRAYAANTIHITGEC